MKKMIMSVDFLIEVPDHISTDDIIGIQFESGTKEDLDKIAILGGRMAIKSINGAKVEGYMTTSVEDDNR